MACTSSGDKNNSSDDVSIGVAESSDGATVDETGSNSDNEGMWNEAWGQESESSATEGDSSTTSTAATSSNNTSSTGTSSKDVSSNSTSSNSASSNATSSNNASSNNASNTTSSNSSSSSSTAPGDNEGEGDWNGVWGESSSSSNVTASRPDKKECKNGCVECGELPMDGKPEECGCECHDSDGPGWIPGWF